MKKLFKRFIAYTIDMMVVLLITQCLSGIPQINKQLVKFEKYSNEYVELTNNYVSFYGDLKKYFEDKELSEEEYSSLVEEHKNYVSLIDKYYVDSSLSNENYDKLGKVLYDDYVDSYKGIYYKMEKYSTFSSVVYLVVIFAYFVFFNIITNGQTLGKKLTRLKIVNSKDENRKVPVWSYIVRALVLYQVISYGTKLIVVNFLDVNMFYNVTSVVDKIESYLMMLIICMIMIRIDGRGLHDMISNTRVALYDKNGKEIKAKPDVFTKKLEEVKLKNSKKVIDEEPTSE